MRKAINDNPTVQIAVIGVLVLMVGLFLMMNMKKSSSSSSTPPSEASATSSPSSSPPGATTAPVTVPGTSASAATAPSASVPTALPQTGGTVPPEALIPGPGLPREVVAAWKRGDAIVLLIVRPHGIDDRLVRDSVESLSGRSNVATFVTRAEHIARYSRITQGVGVDHVPALVVVRPRSESGSTPQAQVSYGFRNSKSVVQAVSDALYTGQDNLPYYPR